MMKYLSKVIGLCTLMTFSSLASAEFISTDWLATNDAKATLDTETGLEWLRFDQTLGLSYDSFRDGEISGFDGWRLPTHTEVSEVVGNIYSGGETASRFGVDANGKQAWVNVFGMSGGGYSLAWYERNTGKVDAVGWHVNNKIYATEFVVAAHDGYRASGSSIISLFLVSDGGTTISSIRNPSMNANNANAPVNNTAVPIPATGGLLALAGLMLWRRNKNT